MFVINNACVTCIFLMGICCINKVNKPLCLLSSSVYVYVVSVRNAK